MLALHILSAQKIYFTESSCHILQDILNRRNRRMGISDTPADEQQGGLDSAKNTADDDGKALFPAYSKEESTAAPTKMVAYFKVGSFTAA